MLYVQQNINDGVVSLAEVPAPMVSADEVLIANVASALSPGTEKMIMELSKKSLLGKARERPDHVRRVLEKIRNEGLFDTIQQVRRKLDEPMSMGYSSSGIVLACGKNVQEFQPGDRVASNGAHAEVVAVPKNLCAKVPDNVSAEQACFAVLGSIALQGVRLSKANLGETVFVIGLGLVGQLTVSLLAASGCRVIGTDLDPQKCELAMKMGATLASPQLNQERVQEFTNGLGADAVLITASTKSNGPIELASAAVRPKGRVVLVGVVGLEFDRRPWYFKEAEFVVSCSYGPGRYDPNYEDRGNDYPAAYVRWTEQRNIQAVLDLMGSGKLDVAPLITHRFDIEEAETAYELIDGGNEPYLGIVLNYPNAITEAKPNTIDLAAPKKISSGIRIGVLGAGNFARTVLLPAIEKSGMFVPQTICSAKGISAAHAGKVSGFHRASSDESTIFQDDDIDAVLSLTRHDQHASHVLSAVRAGKHVFVEKPLCMNLSELQEIDAQLAENENVTVMVGFNRRFSPAAIKLKNLFEDTDSPLTVSFRFNAGEIPPDHWTQNFDEGGGRIIGEACHAIDLATFLVGSLPTRVFTESIGGSMGKVSDDQCFITIRHANGSISNIAYLAGGDKRFPKERIEVIGAGRVGVIEDFKAVTTCKNGKMVTQKMTRDKGHGQEIKAWGEALQKGQWAIPWSELRAVTATSILAAQSIREGGPLDVQ